MKKPSFSYFVISSFLLVAAIVWGYFLGQKTNSLDILNNSFSMLNLFNDLPPFFLFLLILFNNAIKTFFVIVLGFLFGLLPLYFTYINGVILGIVVFLLKEKVGLAPVYAGLLPHGLFEIAALLLAISYGLWLGIRFWRRLFRKESFLPYLKDSMKAYVQYILPLLLVAAIIEAYVTPVFLKMSLLK